MIGKYNYGTGRRKNAVPRVFMKPGKGDIVVNDKPLDVFFSREKNTSSGLSFTVIWPLPGFMNTRATAFLRRPVP